jgi:predicted aspartyl protease
MNKCSTSFVKNMPFTKIWWVCFWQIVYREMVLQVHGMFQIACTFIIMWISISLTWLRNLGFTADVINRSVDPRLLSDKGQRPQSLGHPCAIY